jgi:ArsR family transcriptional regulator, arsenate/arsenite/antimonite-responsive transcriptional repressor / arsenate reductase (thioredoxin)
MSWPPADHTANLSALLTDSVRRQLTSTLMLNDVVLDDLADAVRLPSETVMALLEPFLSAGVITQRRSDAHSDQLYCHLNLELLDTLYQAEGNESLAFAAAVEEGQNATSTQQGARPRILFLCTRNSARSQLAEGITRLLSKGQVEAFSAGNQPGFVHPMAIELLTALHVDVSGQYSKHLDQFLGQDFDYVITVCDNARETCPVFSGAKRTIHWSIPDPAIVEDSEARSRAFSRVATELQNRIRYLLILLERERREQQAVAEA